MRQTVFTKLVQAPQICQPYEEYFNLRQILSIIIIACVPMEA